MKGVFCVAALNLGIIHLAMVTDGEKNGSGIVW